MTQARSGGTLVELLRLLRPFWAILLGATLMGILGGAAVTALLATINQSLHATGGEAAATVLATFAGLCAVVVVGSILADIGTNYVGQHVIARLREELSRKILLAPIDQIERFRTHRLIPVLTQDIDVISDFAFNFSPLAVSLVGDAGLPRLYGNAVLAALPGHHGGDRASAAPFRSSRATAASPASSRRASSRTSCRRTTAPSPKGRRSCGSAVRAASASSATT